jgi:membrane-bound lytic murein transglycosylase D
MKMNEYSLYPFDCHSSVLSAIEDYATRRRNTIRVALGRAELYFDLYESMLDQYNMPLEIKYLSVVESMLLPKARSHAGALGLWQFMYGTGKMFGLVENSHIDERMDPIKATEAACKYLTKLYGIYDDWNLALAAYNAGPGNVNKAIRRAGGKSTYWEVRPFLPKETQDYVPRFMAIAYLMEHYQLHNIKPTEAALTYYDVDTICLSRGAQMQRIEALINLPVEDIKTLNPVYKGTYIPMTNPPQCITLPIEKIALFLEYEQDIYKSNEQFLNATSIPIDSVGGPVKYVTEYENQMQYHKVKKGETISSVARKYGTTTSKLTKLNGLKSGKLTVGQTIKVGQTRVEIQKPIQVNVESNTTLNTEIKEVSAAENAPIPLRTIRHQVKAGQTMYQIAQTYKVTVDDIVKWNSLPSAQVYIGQVVVIYTDDPNLQAQNDLKESKPATSAKPAAKYYTVKKGDTFGAIANKNKTTVKALQKLNPKVNASKLSIGQKIRVK